MNVVLFFLLIIFFIIMPYVGLWMMFKKAGEAGWKAIIPFYASYIMCQLSGRPTWWVALLFIPFVNIFIVIGIYIEFIKSFGKWRLRDIVALVLIPFICLPKWGFDKDTKYLGRSASDSFKERHKASLKKSSGREWTEAIIFAVVAATLIRTFFIEAYTIPTPSMERSLLVGDFLFVSKVNYGARTPMTPVAFPFAHHTMPLIGTKAYWDGLELPYYRLPGLSDVKKGDVVVFNYPMEADSPFNRPVDKRENYIKRCQGTPGDTLSVVNSQVFVNGKAAENPPESQTQYTIVNASAAAYGLNPKLLEDLHISIYEGDTLATMTKASAATLGTYPDVKAVNPVIATKGMADGQTFPQDPQHYKWNADNYGPVIIPKKGWTVKLDSLTIPIYYRAIKVYEGNQVEQKDKNTLYINGAKADTYTFKMNYYWMMGDNRHDSLDSRYWGFVPEDHIVGKALFVWMSWDDNASFIHKIRWSRLFMPIHAY